MKAKLYDKIRILTDVQADFSDEWIPQGTEGTIIECYDEPEGYAVDLSILDDSLVGGYRFVNVILSPDQFTVIKRYELQG